MEDNKEELLEDACKHVGETCQRARVAGEKADHALAEAREEYKSLGATEKVMAENMMRYHTKRIGELEHVSGSPYFVRCDVVWEGEQAVREIYFGKFPFNDEEIYSWVAPASAMRFEDPGEVSYERPDGKRQRATLRRKDQYMISGGEIRFMATESLEVPRELVYQEHFSNRKEGFVLPEIVAQMEKAQDQVIRAHHAGSFVISGPAGSGKTTLALHRVAYLAASPDLAEIYKTTAMIVFVQDNGTRDYFSHLLPELGIEDVAITTFGTWAIETLGLSVTYTHRFTADDNVQDFYEYTKLEALHQIRDDKYEKNVFGVLRKAYGEHMSDDQLKIFDQQKKESTVDRIDLTILLQLYREKYGEIGTEKDVWEELLNGKFRKRRQYVPFAYALAVVDEFQNYLPEQLALMNSCVSAKTKSTLYVGDMAQQVQLGTIENWDEVDAFIDSERQVILQKVYRNTKQILRYIRALGYDAEIPDGLKDGPEVAEVVLSAPEEGVAYINETLSGRDVQSVGILAKDRVYLEPFNAAFAQDKKYHIMTMREAQGVEFDIVFIVGMTDKIFAVHDTADIPEKLARAQKRIKKDLFYVALTRAISELHVLSPDKVNLRVI